MSIATSDIHKKVLSNNNIIWIIAIFFIAIISGITIAYSKWIYLSFLLVPLLLYFITEKPFMFPFGLYVFLLPLDSIFVLSGSAQGQATTKFLALLVIAVLSIKGGIEGKLKRPDTATAILWTLFVLWGVMSLLWAINPQVVLATIRNPIGLLIFYLIVSSYKIQRQEYETLKWFIMGGGIFAGAFSLYNYQQLYSSSEDIYRMAVTIDEKSSGLNSLAYALILPVAVCIEKILEHRKKVVKLALYIAMGIILFSLILTGSRGAMLGVAVIFAINIISLKRKITYVTALIIIGMLLAPFIPGFVFERWEIALETGGDGRTDIWYVGLSALLGKYLAVGAGLGNFPMAYDEFAHVNPAALGSGRAPHNTFLGIFVELGIIGISLMMLGIWKSYKKIRTQFDSRNTVDSIMLKAALGGMIIVNFTGDSAFDKSFWLLLMMISMHHNLSIRPHGNNF